MGKKGLINTNSHKSFLEVFNHGKKHARKSDSIWRSGTNLWVLKRLGRGENVVAVIQNDHSVWKSAKKSHSILRAKRAAFTFWVDKKLIKNAKNGPFWLVLKAWILRSKSVTRQINFSRAKIGGKCKNWKLQMRHFQ